MILRVLLVDDNAPLRATIHRMLAGHDMTVMEAEDGLAALRLLQLEHFDLMITDLTMPRMTGLSLIAEIRREQTDVGIIAMSGGTREDTSVAFGQQSASAAVTMLRKPFRSHELFDAVREAISKQDAKRGLHRPDPS